MLYSLTLVNNSAVTLRAVILGAENAYSAVISGTLTTGVRRAGAAAILAGTPIINSNDDFLGPVSFNASVSGNDIQIIVTGLAATTINWRALINLTTLP